MKRCAHAYALVCMYETLLLAASQPVSINRKSLSFKTVQLLTNPTVLCFGKAAARPGHLWCNICLTKPIRGQCIHCLCSRQQHWNYGVLAIASFLSKYQDTKEGNKRPPQIPILRLNIFEDSKFDKKRFRTRAVACERLRLRSESRVTTVDYINVAPVRIIITMRQLASLSLLFDITFIIKFLLRFHLGVTYMWLTTSITLFDISSNICPFHNPIASLAIVDNPKMFSISQVSFCVLAVL